MKLPAPVSRTQDLLKDLKNGTFKPIYLLMGEEPYFIDKVTNYIEEHALEPHEREFNQTVIYGLDTDPMDLVSAVKRYPMMAERQVVIVREAQRMKGLEKIIEVVKDPVPTTVLVLAHKDKNIDKRTNFGKLINKTAEVLKSDRLRDYELVPWITRLCQSQHIAISTVSAQLLADHIGTDLERIENELEKLSVALPKGTEITPAVIEKHIGISKDFNVFELQKAIGQKHTEKAFKIVHYFGKNPKDHPVIATTAMLFAFFTKLYQYHYLKDKGSAASALRIPPFFVKEYASAASYYSVPKIERIFGYLNETDLKAKGVDNPSTDGHALLQELVFKILN